MFQLLASPPPQNYLFTWHWVKNLVVFFKINHQFHIETLIKLQHVLIKLFTWSGELSFNIICIYPVCKWSYVCLHVHACSECLTTLANCWVRFHYNYPSVPCRNDHTASQNMYQARHSMWCAVIQYLSCLLREKHLFTCCHARRSLTTLTDPASTLATLIKTTLCQAESEWYGVTVFPLPSWGKECQKQVYLLMCSSHSKTGQKLSHLLFPFHLPCAHRKPDLPTCTNRVGHNRPEKLNIFNIPCITIFVNLCRLER